VSNTSQICMLYVQIVMCRRDDATDDDNAAAADDNTSLITAAQDQTLNTHYHERNSIKQSTDSECATRQIT
jgi:hypothetical protein